MGQKAIPNIGKDFSSYINYKFCYVLLSGYTYGFYFGLFKLLLLWGKPQEIHQINPR
jgi:hypothetical protein